ncbi:MAG: hypothetical protein IJ870_00435 [Alphaproteobacteria bacterium]|nr:hypothetical protein [Alphaproteobacteria bacterium]
MEIFELENITKHLLNPQKKLPEWIFDKNGKMHENVRQGLLKIAQFVIDKTIADIKGLEVYDIVLTGSLPTYFYHKDSDIDMRILVKNKNCSDITTDTAGLDTFLTIQKNILKACGYAFKYLDLAVDVKITSVPIEYVGLYSLIKNRFRIHPNKKIGEGISINEVLDAYFQEQKNIIRDVKKIDICSEGLEKVFALDDLYHQIYKNSYITKIYKDYLIFKLVSKSGVLGNLIQTYIDKTNQVLSFPYEEKISLFMRIKRLLYKCKGV